MPVAAVPTYTDRPRLSDELSGHLKRLQGEAGVAHAVAVVGIGGAGKSQLVLHYIETHEEEYDTIFWIDVRSKETARSSYERCCRALHLPSVSTAGDVALEDSPSVQAVLLDLRNRSEGNRWLVVVDNADDLSWDVSSVVPRGREGSVIVTSQDANARQLLGGCMGVADVDVMELGEALALMTRFFGESMYLEDAHRQLMEDIVKCLDRLPLAIDLASARIQDDAQRENDLGAALRRYLNDFRRRQSQLLRREAYLNVSSYKKTVWTVWDASISSLSKAEKDQPDIHATHLLKFLTFFDRANVQEEMFRLASLELQDTCNKLGVSAPDWMRDLFEKDEDGNWDDYRYRSSMGILLRYGLVRPVEDVWRGVTMHGLIKWRAGLDMDRIEYRQWYLVFLTAACEQASLVLNHRTLRFRRHLAVHLPPNTTILKCRLGVDGDAYPWYIWKTVANVWFDEGRYGDALELLEKVVETQKTLLGEENPKTITSMTDLALCMFEQGLRCDAEELCSKAMKLGKQFLPLDDPVTLTSMHRLALIWKLQGRYDDATGLNETVLEARKKVLPLHDPTILSTMFNLASAYAAQKRFDEAAKLQEEVLAENLKVYGKGHVRTLTSMGNVARTLFDQGRPEAAENLEELVLEGMKSAVGENHPYTIRAMINLSSTYLAQGRTKEAETLAVEAKERCEKVLPPDNPIAVECRDVLDEIHAERRRREGAKGLETEILELSLEEHPVA